MTHRSWKLETAKAQFSEVVRDAESGQPQLITRRGQPVAVVISAREYALQEQTGWDVFAKAPHVEEFEPVRPTGGSRKPPEF
ncbi:Antitoxin [Deinococcus saxicola]|uniref:type II toxin-antitoxin system Phd/YefM family antitoxin n=1 Tax=Deinococcus saxicola TaxID=249406 RepID=UPI0039F13BC2